MMIPQYDHLAKERPTPTGEQIRELLRLIELGRLGERRG